MAAGGGASLELAALLMQLVQRRGEGQEGDEAGRERPAVTIDIGDDDAIRPVFVLSQREGRLEARIAPGLDAVGPIRSCSVGHDHSALLPAHGTLMCYGGNGEGQLGVGDAAPRGGPRPTAPPLSASAVWATYEATFALDEHGTVFSWGDADRIGRGGSRTAPAAVRGLPPVALLAAGGHCTVAITRDDQAYGWAFGAGCLPGLGAVREARPVPVAALSGRGIRRVACSFVAGAAETRRGELLVWGVIVGAPDQPVRLQPHGMLFPLRALLCSMVVTAVDAAGTLWVVDRRAVPVRAQLRRVVDVVKCGFETVALTEEGELWVGTADSWRPIRAARSERPLGLVPYGGPDANRAVLAPDHCGGKWRLRLFAYAAMRMGVPSGPVREALAPLLVHKVYLTGPSSDPFGCPAALG